MIGLIKAAGLFSQRQPHPDINAGVVQVPTYDIPAPIMTPIPPSKPVVTAKPVAKQPAKPVARPTAKPAPKAKPNYREIVRNPVAGEMDENERYFLADRPDGSSPASRGERY